MSNSRATRRSIAQAQGKPLGVSSLDVHLRRAAVRQRIRTLNANRLQTAEQLRREAEWDLIQALPWWKRWYKAWQHRRKYS